jgi:hypothetical protein
MITFSGVHIQKSGGASGTPTCEDIAVQSGRICRYAGAIWMPLITHLILVGLLAYRRSNEVLNLIWGFLHDANEITGEVTQNFKCDCLRREQAAIDDRLLVQFGLDGGADFIDYRLIKQCDLDACDLEAVELGLPNYSVLAVENALQYRKYRIERVHSDVNDRRLLLALLRSPFYRNTLSEFSPGVIAFRDVLRLAEARKYDEFLASVKGWNLL